MGLLHKSKDAKATVAPAKGTSAEQLSGPKQPAPGTQPPNLYDGPRASEASIDKTRQVQAQVDEVTGQMNKNVSSMLERGENLEDLNKQSEELKMSSAQFSKNAAKVKRNLWWKNVKLGIIVASIILLIVIAAVVYGVMTSKKEKKE